MDNQEEKMRLTAVKVRTLNITLDNMKNFAARFNSDVNNPNQIYSRMEELNTMLSNFQQAQDDLERLEVKDDVTRVTERLSFQEKWFDVKAALKELIQHVIFISKENIPLSRMPTDGRQLSRGQFLPLSLKRGIDRARQSPIIVCRLVYIQFK